jgi:tripartite-type tricarboxylate transporter receptor subunit TctC
MTLVAAWLFASLSCLGVYARRRGPAASIEFVIPVGTGGGADQMIRSSPGLPAQASPRPIICQQVGGAGARVPARQGQEGRRPHDVITLSNLFTTPLHTGVLFGWRDHTHRPLASTIHPRVNAETPYQDGHEYIAAGKESRRRRA